MKKRSVLLATFLGLSMCLGMGTQNEGHRVYVKADEVVSGGAVGTEYAYIIGDVLVNYVNEQAAVTNDDMIMSYTVPDSIRRIGDYAFSGYQGLDEVIMSNSVQEIGCSAFSSCYSLERVKLSENLTTIGREAFQGCERLTELVLPSTLTEIGPGAFPATCKLIVTQGSYAETYVKENRYAYQYTTGETFEGSVDAGRIDETPIPIITLAPTQEPEETVNPQTTLDPQTTLNPQTTLEPQTTVTPGENGGKVVAPGKVTLKSVKKASKTKIKVKIGRAHV